MGKVFLYGPQDFRNLCVLARTLEVFGVRKCYVFDSYRLIRERYGKARTREQRVVSAGAFEKIRWVRVEDPTRFLVEYPGRVVATLASEKAIPLERFRFLPADLLLFGPEGAGLPDEIVTKCGAAVTIPARGETQSLNLAVALGIVLFESERQLRAAHG